MWRRWGIPQNFSSAFIDELEKQTNKQLLRKLLNWANKKQNNLNIYNVELFLKNRKTPVDMIIKILIWSTVPEIQNILKLVILGHFLPFYPPKKTPKLKFWKMKKFAQDIIILHMCTENHNIWCMVPEIPSETDIIFCHFGPFFCPFTPLTLLILKKMKKPPGDIITLHMCTINDNHMMYGSWDMERDGQNFSSFWILLSFSTLLSPVKTWKIKILKKWKNT